MWGGKHFAFFFSFGKEEKREREWNNILQLAYSPASVQNIFDMMYKNALKR